MVVDLVGSWYLSRFILRRLKRSLSDATHVARPPRTAQGKAVLPPSTYESSATTNDAKATALLMKEKLVHNISIFKHYFFVIEGIVLTLMFTLGILGLENESSTVMYSRMLDVNFIIVMSGVLTILITLK